MEAAHPQMGPATGTLTLSKSYGTGSFKIAHGQTGGTANVTLSAAAKNLLAKNGKLSCKASIKAKDLYGTAAVTTPVTIR